MWKEHHQLPRSQRCGSACIRFFEHGSMDGLTSPVMSRFVTGATGAPKNDVRFVPSQSTKMSSQHVAQGIAEDLCSNTPAQKVPSAMHCRCHHCRSQRGGFVDHSLQSLMIEGNSYTQDWFQMNLWTGYHLFFSSFFFLILYQHPLQFPTTSCEALTRLEMGDLGEVFEPESVRQHVLRADQPR